MRRDICKNIFLYPGRGVKRKRICLAALFLAAALQAAGCGKGAGTVQSHGKGWPGGEGGGLAGTIRLAGSTSMEEYVSALAEGFMEKYPNVTVTIEYVGSSAGAEAVAEGSVDIGNLSRRISDAEKAGGLVENIVAVDGIVVCVDRANAATGLTLQQLKDIYAGRITNWGQAGGASLPIVVVGREPGSGTREAFEKLLGLEEQCVYANEMDSSGAVMVRVARTPGAIGYLSLDAVDGTIRVLSLDGTEPDTESIGSGEYPLSREYIMATKGEIASQPVLLQSWFEFVYGEDGQRIAEMTGLAPVMEDRGR